MPKKRLGAEQIVTKLRQVEVSQSQGKSVAAACKEVGLRAPFSSPFVRIRARDSKYTRRGP